MFNIFSDDKTESVAELKEELEQTKEMVAKLRQEVSFQRI